MFNFLEKFQWTFESIRVCNVKYTAVEAFPLWNLRACIPGRIMISIDIGVQDTVQKYSISPSFGVSEYVGFFAKSR